MDLRPDLIDLLTEFANFGVEYLVVGGWAVAAHGKPRYTKDLDLWIGTSPSNLQKVVVALRAFGAPGDLVEDVAGMSDQEFVFFGAPPARIDILRSIPGAVFEEAWQRRSVMKWGSATVNVIAIEDLIATKHVGAGEDPRRHGIAEQCQTDDDFRTHHESRRLRPGGD